MRACRAALALVLFCAAASIQGQDVDGFAARTFTAAGGISMPYRLFVPAAEARGGSLPIVLYLHGKGGGGTDNLRQITKGNTRGTHLWTTPQLQARFPAFVLAPQIPEDVQWRSSGPDISAHAAVVLELLQRLSQEYRIDANRIYLVGQSMGGFGAWDLIAKRPDLFAAAVPLCGGGDPPLVAAARRVPVWAFHGSRDGIVPVARSRDAVAALRAAGGQVKYTEYPRAAHDIWTLAFSEPDLPGWLFAQKRMPND